MTGCTDEKALLKAILADPADDLPRLAYADLLGEKGEYLHEEFVRVQMELSVIRTEMYLDPDNSEDNEIQQRLNWLRIRERQLLSRGIWCPLPFPPEWAWWRRGFVSLIKCTHDEWLEWGPRIVRSHPLEQLHITDKEPMSHGPVDRVAWIIRNHQMYCKKYETQYRTTDRDIHTCIWDLMTSPKYTACPYWRGYEVKEETIKDFHDACLLWARDPVHDKEKELP